MGSVCDPNRDPPAVITVPQLLADLAPTLSVDALARACHEAEVRFGVRPSEVRTRRRGDEFRRHTYRDVAEEPRPMLAELAALLA